MKYIQLGASGVAVSTLTLGAMTFGTETAAGDAQAIMSAYAAAGGNVIDTADTYGLGESERIVGSWLRDHPTEAARMVIATKARYPMSDDPNDLGLSRLHLRRSLDSSLRRLGVDHIDLYQLHGWEPWTRPEEALRFLDDAIADGKIGYYGLSNFHGWQLATYVQRAAAAGWTPPVSLQAQYNLLEREVELEIIPAARYFGLAVLAWSPLAGGWLTDKYRSDRPPTSGTRLGPEDKNGLQVWRHRINSPRTEQVMAALRETAGRRRLTPAQIALAWLASRDTVTSTIVGVRSLDQINEALAGTGAELDHSERDALDAAGALEVGDYPYGRMGATQHRRRASGGW